MTETNFTASPIGGELNETQKRLCAENLARLKEHRDNPPPEVIPDYVLRKQAAAVAQRASAERAASKRRFKSAQRAAAFQGEPVRMTSSGPPPTPAPSLLDSVPS